MKLNAICLIVLTYSVGQVAGTETTQAEATAAKASDGIGDSSALPSYKQFVDGSRSLLRAEAKSKSVSDQVELTLGIVKMSKRLEADPRYATSPTLKQIRGKLHARLRTIKKKTTNADRRNKQRPERIEIRREVLGQLNQALNGARANRNNRPNNNAFPADYGPMLVELIHRTISPSSWDVNGGASTIQYWRPGMALVVRAPQTLHEDLTPVLRQLRMQ